MKFRSIYTRAAMAILGCLAPAAILAQELPAVQQDSNGALYRTGEIVLKFKPSADGATIEEAFKKARLKSKKHIHTDAMKKRGEPAVTLAETDLDVDAAVKVLKDDPEVEYAQPNWVYNHLATTLSFDDQFLANGNLWGMTASTPYGADAAGAWNAGYTGSSSVYVGVIDEGIQPDHQDLARNIWTNPNPDPVLQDVHGINAITGKGDIYDAANDDHGTHVAGTIGGLGGNKVGVAGVNWNAQIVSGKFLGQDGGTTADAVEAIDYMTNLKETKGLNVVALNNSWGGGPFDNALLDSITRAARANILFVAAAGNGDRLGRGINNDSTPQYPASYNTTAGAGYDSVIAVAAIDKNGNKAPWSNYGATSVDIGAPGVAITSTTPGNTYSSYDGTSMATPHVTGAIALYASTHPNATAKEIREALLASASLPENYTLSLVGKTVTNGRLNVVDFLNTPSGVPIDPTLATPAAPEIVADQTVPLKSTQVKVTWTDNSNNEAGFRINRQDTSGNTFSVVVAPDRTNYVDTAAVAATEYAYTVSAFNAGVAGETTSAPITVTTPAPEPYVAPVVTALGKDNSTKGTWQGRYGGDGFQIFNDSVNLPTYATVQPAGHSSHTWSASTTDVRAPQKGNNPNDRIAACWFSASSFTLDVNVDSAEGKRVAIYGMDWDTTVRAQKFEVIDAMTGIVLDTQTSSGATFQGGEYVIWNIKGHVIIKITRTGDYNCVIQGIFFDSPTAAPAAPTTLTATAASASQIDLSWIDTADNENGFAVERSTDGVNYTQIATVASNITSFAAVNFSNSGLAGSTKYYYRVRAFNTAGNSGYISGTATTPAAPGPVKPVAPNGLVATTPTNRGAIDLKWNDNSSNEQGFKIERSTYADFRTITQVATVGVNVKTYRNTGLKNATMYYYRVRAYNSVGNSDYTNVSAAQTR